MARRASNEYHVRKSMSVSSRNPYDTRPLVAVETKPPLKEKVRRLFGMRPIRYVAYTPAVAMTTTTPRHHTHPVRTHHSGTSGVRTHYSGSPVSSNTTGGSYYSSPSSSTYVRRTTTTRRR